MVTHRSPPAVNSIGLNGLDVAVAPDLDLHALEPLLAVRAALCRQVGDRLALAEEPAAGVGRHLAAERPKQPIERLADRLAD